MIEEEINTGLMQVGLSYDYNEIHYLFSSEQIKYSACTTVVCPTDSNNEILNLHKNRDLALYNKKTTL